MMEEEHTIHQTESERDINFNFVEDNFNFDDDTKKSYDSEEFEI